MMHHHSTLAGMLPYDTGAAPASMGLYAHEQPKPRFFFKMPRVVPDQKSKFESDELFRRLSRESEVRYTGYRDRPQDERRIRFQNACREGHIEIAFVATGTNLQLIFSTPVPNGVYVNGGGGGGNGESVCDFEKDPTKVSIRSPFIMNGVCVRFKGWLDLDRLDGNGCLEFDERQANIEDALLRDQIDRYNQRLREFEEKQRLYTNVHHHEIGIRMANNSLDNHNSNMQSVRCHNTVATSHRPHLPLGVSLTPP